MRPALVQRLFEALRWCKGLFGPPLVRKFHLVACMCTGRKPYLGDEIPTPRSAVEVAGSVKVHAVRDVLEEGPSVGSLGL